MQVFKIAFRIHLDLYFSSNEYKKDLGLNLKEQRAKTLLKGEVNF